ncbi:Reticulon-4-interacting protein 1, mitochondrial [Madurella mycetomatis]|uniref:Reticulon-4-interacting protein 1, mitochondrial n=1 Tax=Madurella mycetomatis TaxID=100816 RepID=A0A175WFP2_9PEZI|nr:Reticulon-4-interacting protein 1, mitochondrial [Madurella mycetomatis]
MASESLPQTMKTLLQPSVKTTELISTTAPVPTPSHPDDVLVRVHAAAPCAGELTWAMNFPDAIPADKELVPCQDMAGTVVSAPAGSGFAAGDRVYCRISAERAGAARDYALPRASELAKIPPSLSWIEAAATPLSALTAWQALFVQGTLDAAGIEGDAAARERNGKIRVLVTGAAGGVGSWVVQLAALAGAKAVVAVCGPGKEEAVRELGATEVVNYRETSIEEWVAVDPAARECDLIIEMVGGKTLTGCWAAVRDGGSMICINTPPDVGKPAGLNKTLSKGLFFIVEPLGSNLARIGELIEVGRLRPTIDSVWEFADFEKAFERLDSGHAKGKIIIKVSDEA